MAYIFGFDTADSLEGGPENDTVDGFGGLDTLSGLGGNDILLGGTEPDTLIGGVGADTLYGGAGSDTASYANALASVRVALDGSLAATGDALGDVFDSIEALLGTPFADTLRGDALPNGIVGGAGNDLLQGGDGGDVIYGLAGDDTVEGGAGGDILFGGSTDLLLDRGSIGNDSFSGGDGNDSIIANGDGAHTIDGGAGQDTIYAVGLNSVIFGGGSTWVFENGLVSRASRERLEGGAGNDTIYGSDKEGSAYGLQLGLQATNTWADWLLGSGGNDLLIGGIYNGVWRGGVGDEPLGAFFDGGPGDDTITGTLGADTLMGGHGNDFLRLAPIGAPNDPHQGDLSFSIRESLSLDPTDELSPSRSIGSHWDVFARFLPVSEDPLNLADPHHIEGLIGNDRRNELYGNKGANTLIGLGGNDTLSGKDGADSLDGGAGDDSLDGGAGDDTLAGGDGNDFYDFVTPGDVVIERPGGGEDTIGVWISFTLAALPEIEHLRLRELREQGVSGPVIADPINGTGNALANSILGNSAANVLAGAGGDDILFGAAGDDVLNGGPGADTLRGSTGNDRYVVDDAGDQAEEILGDGRDLVIASVDWTLTDGIENLTLTGLADLDGTGNALVNRLAGNAGANALSGLGGNDAIIGGAGADTLDGGVGRDALTGGADADLFLFADPSQGLDRVTDFTPGLDRLGFASAAFGALPAGVLDAAHFVARASYGATTASGVPQFIFHTGTFVLSFDADGRGGAAAQRIAVLTGTPVLTPDDLIIVG